MILREIILVKSLDVEGVHGSPSLWPLSSSHNFHSFGENLFAAYSGVRSLLSLEKRVVKKSRSLTYWSLQILGILVNK